MLLRRMRWVGLAWLLAGCTACSDGPGPSGPPGYATNRWTIMVYMAADNSLNSYAGRDVNEMEAGLASAGLGARAGAEVILLFDPRTQGDWTDTRLYRILPDTNLAAIASERLDDGAAGRGHCPPLGERNTGDGATLAWFMAHCRTNFPAGQYALILWNHGGGARAPARLDGQRGAVRISACAASARGGGSFGPEAVPHTTGAGASPLREIAFDQLADDVIWLDELAAALATHRDAAGPLAVLGMDACLMGCVETAWEMRGLTRVLVASMANEPQEGWDYQRIFSALDEATLSAEAFSTVIVDSYHALHSPDGVATGSGVTLSAVDCDKLGPLRSAVDELARELALWLAPAGVLDTTRRGTFETLRDRATRFFDYRAADGYQEVRLAPWIDLADLAAVLSDGTNALPQPVRDAAGAVRQALSAAVIRAYGDSGISTQPYYHGSGLEVGRGLSIFVSPGEYVYNDGRGDWSLWAHQAWYTAQATGAGAALPRGGIDFASSNGNGSVDTWVELFDLLYDGAGQHVIAR